MRNYLSWFNGTLLWFSRSSFGNLAASFLAFLTNRFDFIPFGIFNFCGFFHHDLGRFLRFWFFWLLNLLLCSSFLCFRGLICLSRWRIFLFLLSCILLSSSNNRCRYINSLLLDFLLFHRSNLLFNNNFLFAITSLDFFLLSANYFLFNFFLNNFLDSIFKCILFKCFSEFTWISVFLLLFCHRSIFPLLVSEITLIGDGNHAISDHEQDDHTNGEKTCIHLSLIGIYLRDLR